MTQEKDLQEQINRNLEEQQDIENAIIEERMTEAQGNSRLETLKEEREELEKQLADIQNFTKDTDVQLFYANMEQQASDSVTAAIGQHPD